MNRRIRKMKHLNLFKYMSFLLAAMLFFAGGIGSSNVRGAEPKTVAVLSPGSYDSLFKAIDKIASPLGYHDTILGLQVTTADVQGLDKTSPCGLIVLHDEKAFKVYGFIPAKSLEDLQFSNADDMKKNIFKKGGKTFLKRPAGKPLQVVERNGGLWIFQEGDESSLPPGEPKKYFGEISGKYNLGLQLYPEQMPEELIDSIGAILRQQAANTAVDVQAQVTQMKKYFKVISPTVRKITVGLRFDAKGNSILETDILPVPGSSLEKTYTENRKITTRWADVNTLPNTVFNTLFTMVLSPEERQYQTDSCSLSFDKMITDLETSIDNDKDFEQAKKILENVKGIVVSVFEKKEKLDSAFALTSDRLLVLTFTLADSSRVTDLMKQIYEYAKNSNGETTQKNITLKTEKVNNYSLSILTISRDALKDTLKDNMGFCPEKAISIIVASDKDSAMVVASYDPDKTMDLVKKLTASAAKEKPAPAKRATFSIRQLGILLQNFKIKQAGPDTVWGKVIDSLAKTDAKAVCTTEINWTENHCLQQQTMAVESWKAVGEAIRTATGQKQDKKKANETLDDSIFNN